MDNVVLCASSAYKQKYYLNPMFDHLPAQIKEELKIMCVLFTEDVGGILSLEFDKDRNLILYALGDEEDLLYDDIGSGLKIKKIIQEKQELFKQLELYYQMVVLQVQ